MQGLVADTKLLHGDELPTYVPPNTISHVKGDMVIIESEFIDHIHHKVAVTKNKIINLDDNETNNSEELIELFKSNDYKHIITNIPNDEIFNNLPDHLTMNKYSVFLCARKFNSNENDDTICVIHMTRV